MSWDFILRAAGHLCEGIGIGVGLLIVFGIIKKLCPNFWEDMLRKELNKAETK